jgi:hypothetical protein
LIIQGVFTLAAFFFVVPLLLIAISTAFQSIEAMRWPIYSHFNNQKSASYNRATTLSLSNLMKSVMDIPLLFLASLLVSYDIRWIFLLALVLTVLTFMLTRLKTTTLAPRIDILAEVRES